MRSWINIAESFSKARFIEVNDDGCAAEGYVVDTSAEQLDNWFSHRHRVSLPAFIASLRDRYTTIAFLNNINVEDEARGRGLGNQMMGDFIEEAAQNGAEAIILAADMSEEQAAGFDLVKWYQGWGFEVIPSAASDPLMIMEMDS